MGLRQSNFKRYLILFSIIPLILLIGIVPGLSFADYSEQPYDQIDDGFLPHEITCQIDKILIIRNNGFPACVFEDTAAEWVEDEMGITDPLLQCISGFVYLQYPGTDAIICQRQSNVQKYVYQGWVALDGPPPKKETKLDQCKGGEIHIQVPTLGTILCKFPSAAQKYIDRGWKALDELPTFTQTGAAQCNAAQVAMSGDITGTVDCVKKQNVDLYKSHGFTLIEEEPKTGDSIMYEMTACRGGTFHLQNPSSGVIMCAIPSIVPKYVDRGWVPLDELPFNVS